MATYGSIEDLQITHNTALDIRGTQSQFFSYAFGRGEGVVVKNNLFTHNNDNGAGALTLAGRVGDMLVLQDLSNRYLTRSSLSTRRSPRTSSFPV